MTNDQFQEVYDLLFHNLTIISSSLIPNELFNESLSICKVIDIDDTEFLAITKFINGTLWTGDLKLIKGLKKAGFNKCITTEELLKDFTSKLR